MALEPPSPAPAETSSRRWQWWLWLAGPELLAVASCALGNRFPWDESPSQFLVWLREGIIGAQISLAAAVAAWAPLPLPLRVGISWAWIAGGLGALCLFGAYTPEAYGLLLSAGAVQWLFVVLMFYAAWTFGIRLVDQDKQILQNTNRQFSLLDLMLFTAEVAVALAIGRAIWPQFLARGWDPASLMDWLAVAGGNILLFNAVVTCFHVPRRWWINVLLAAFFALLIAGLEVFALWKLGSPGEPWQPFVAPLFVLNGVQLGWLIFAVWRLDRAKLYLRRVVFGNLRGLLGRADKSAARR